MDLCVDPMSNNPTEAWEVLKKSRKVMRFKVQNPIEPPKYDKVRVVCMSDTHSLTSHIKRKIPDGDIFIHAGDFTRSGSLKEVKEFNNWIGGLPHKTKIVIAGNHELSMDPSYKGRDNISKVGSEWSHSKDFMTYVSEGSILGRKCSREEIVQELTNCIYLEDSSIELYGLKFYGTPWQPEFGGWAFNLKRGQELMNKWDMIPTDTDILITHSPPVGYGDHCCTGVRAGCVELLHTVQKRVRPKYHVYGHIHEGYGVRSDGKVIFVNASTCDINYLPNNRPIVFDIAVSEPYHRHSP